MRRLLALAVIAAAGCSPAQEAAWRQWYNRHPQAAAEWAATECGPLCSDDWDRDGVVEPEPARDASPGPTTDQPDVTAGEDHWQPSGQCSQWYGTAIGVGFTDAEWPTLDAILWQESRCDPSAYNPTEHFGGHASGLAQIIWPTWAGECGSGDIFDPWFNLECALYLKTHYGWSQWTGF